MLWAMDTERAIARLGEPIAKIFIEQAQELEESKISELEPLIDVHMEAVYQARSSNAEIDIRLADELAGACKVLLRMYGSFGTDARAAVVGAVRYFVTSQDADNDLRSKKGFHDDAAVLNHVIELTGSGITPISID
jgi:uncharacterized membrane protein YkvA (DUF1232 family)